MACRKKLDGGGWLGPFPTVDIARHGLSMQRALAIALGLLLCGRILGYPVGRIRRGRARRRLENQCRSRGIVTRGTPSCQGKVHSEGAGDNVAFIDAKESNRVVSCLHAKGAC